MNKFIERLCSKKWFKYTSSIIVNLWNFIMGLCCFILGCQNIGWQNNPEAIAFPLWISIVIIAILSILLIFVILFLIKWLKELKNKKKQELTNNRKNKKTRIFNLIFYSTLLISSSVINIFLASNSIDKYINLKNNFGYQFMSPIGIIFEIIIYLIFAIISVTYYAFLIKKLLQKPKDTNTDILENMS